MKFLQQRINRNLFFLVIPLLLAPGLKAQNISIKSIDKDLKKAAEQYQALMQKVPENVMPESFENDSLKTCTSGSWVAGFYPGTLLYLYEATKQKALYAGALKKIKLMDKEQYNTSTHDLGFMMYCSYGNLYHMSPGEKYKAILLNSARSLITRFNPKVGCIRSWGNQDDNTEFKVIIDNMMNLELLFWATKVSGDSSFYKIAVIHANTTLKNHFRPDNSSYHVVVYNPQTGDVIRKETAQGAADASAWARGQSWGLYGYTVMYRETKNKKYLEQAQRIAGFVLNNKNFPADKIPYWDYDAPGIPNVQRDASAAAIMASALIELSGYSNPALAKKYLQTVSIILQTLSSSNYSAAIGENGGFILKHSVASMPAHAEVDVPLPYADYYYVEAMMRYRNIVKKDSDKVSIKAKSIPHK
ncbi:MAG: glycoside hydrolase family 88 protein [Ginsengibacter sp.]